MGKASSLSSHPDVQLAKCPCSHSGVLDLSREHLSRGCAHPGVRSNTALTSGNGQARCKAQQLGLPLLSVPKKWREYSFSAWLCCLNYFIRWIKAQRREKKNRTGKTLFVFPHPILTKVRNSAACHALEGWISQSCSRNNKTLLFSLHSVSLLKQSFSSCLCRIKRNKGSNSPPLGNNETHPHLWEHCSNPHHLGVPSTPCSAAVEQTAIKVRFCLCWGSQLHFERDAEGVGTSTCFVFGQENTFGWSSCVILNFIFFF